ncbi:kinase-like domain-containing protein [Russula earlei]|uniref:Kinase-like domain-containing protein n=1 Tax=Russula earlei TaxID=71964 RepID=A0ACC0U882_9AGAM|nr:kinase-like domain-containing protein [Russula earlei]
MPDLVYRFLTPVQMLQETHSNPSISVIRDLVDKRHNLRSLFVHSAPPPYASLDETAPLLARPPKPDGSICASPLVQPEDFRPLRLISEGVSGKVYMVEDRITNKIFALKVVRKRSDNLLQVISEKDALCKVARIPWFLSLEASMHDDINFYLLTTLYRTDLRHDLHLRGGHIPVPLARFYMAELICALEVLHARGIIHRDVKPANVLLTSHGCHVVLADFGLAKVFPKILCHFPTVVITPYGDVRGPYHVTREKTGTLAYAAPEVRLELPYSYGVDFWSLGVLLYVMLTGRFPFGPLGEWHTHRFEPVEVDDAAQTLLERMLNLHPSKRPNIHELKAHRFFSSIDWDSVATRAQPAPLTPRFPEPSPSPKTLRIPFGTPYGTSSGPDPMPHFTFTSSRFRESRCELTRASPVVDVAKKTWVAGLLCWIAEFSAKLGTWCASVGSLLCTFRRREIHVTP